VLPLIQSLPRNPKDRNFWKLLGKYRAKILHETYHYAFYIVSAAVIGENPRIFGFNFDNSLGHWDLPSVSAGLERNAVKERLQAFHDARQVGRERSHVQHSNRVATLRIDSAEDNLLPILCRVMNVDRKRFFRAPDSGRLRRLNLDII
jgi:hypothetical protein